MSSPRKNDDGMDVKYMVHMPNSTFKNHFDTMRSQLGTIFDIKYRVSHGDFAPCHLKVSTKNDHKDDLSDEDQLRDGANYFVSIRERKERTVIVNEEAMSLYDIDTVGFLKILCMKRFGTQEATLEDVRLVVDGKVLECSNETVEKAFAGTDWVATAIIACRASKVHKDESQKKEAKARKKELDQLEEEQEKKRGVQIFVKMLDGSTKTFRINLDETVSMLKYFIFLHMGTEPDQQRLIFGGHYLDDNKTLREEKIDKESTIHFTGNLRGGMLHETSGKSNFKYIY